MINQPVNTSYLPKRTKNIPVNLRRLSLKEKQSKPVKNINVFCSCHDRSQPLPLEFLWGRFSCSLDFSPIRCTASENKIHTTSWMGMLFPSLLGICVYERLQKSNRQRRYNTASDGSGLVNQPDTGLQLRGN